MKFRNKKTGEIYDMTSKDYSGSGFCSEISCSDCPIMKRRGDLSCRGCGGGLYIYYQIVR